jgi:tetratricopeptide (TPR) repeat protein
MRRAFFCLLILYIPAMADMAAGDKAYANHDWPAALKEYLPLAKQGNAEAQFRVGFIDCQGAAPQYAEALTWFRQAAQKGHPNAQFNLGQMYSLGQGVAKDPAAAVKWYRMAADKGFADAQLKLGIAYDDGVGVQQDYKEAAKLYRLAATNPHPQEGRAIAEFSLGVLYHEGKGMPKDMKEAAKWFEMAADRGYPEAQFNIGWMYYIPQGVEENFVKAYAWITLAARSAGTPSVVAEADTTVAGRAREMSAELAKKMTPQQLADAERLIRGWKPRKN